MTPLEALLRRDIALTGPMTIGRFMDLALLHPQYGYYTGRDPLGRAGDFTTAPEISQMFGEMVGVWLADLWMRMGGPSPFSLIECGPGRGTLMADLLRATRGVPGFHAAMRLHLVEAGEVLRQRQAEALSVYAPRWHATLAEVPEEGPVFLIGNEFLDALSIRQIQRTPSGWAERMVGVEGDALTFGLAPCPPDLLAMVPEAVQARMTSGEVVEVSPARLSFWAEACARVARSGGAILMLDYGYDVSAPGDTLQAMRGHAFVPVLSEIGEADLTAHVDFDALVREAQAAGLKAHGPVSQGAFLERLGIRVRAERLCASASEAQAAEIHSALTRLTAPEQMGTLFRALAVTADPDVLPAGFS